MGLLDIFKGNNELADHKINDAPAENSTFQKGLDSARAVLRTKDFKQGESFWAGIRRIWKESLTEMRKIAEKDMKERHAQQKFEEINNKKALK